MQTGEMIEELFALYLSDRYWNDYNARQRALRGLYEDYSTATQGAKETLNRLLATHASYCKQLGDSELLRKHNTFVLRYVAGRSVKEIARHNKVNVRTVYRDIDGVFENLMILAFGVYGVYPLECIATCQFEETEV